MPEYKALTLYQPWADLVAYGLKKFETRGWKTSHRGLLFIHAAKKWSDEESQYAARFRREYPAVAAALTDTVPLGCIVAVVKLVDCIPVEVLRDSLTAQERAFGNYEDGRYAWKLELVKRPPVPIPAQGKQGLWTWQYTTEGKSA